MTCCSSEEIIPDDNKPIMPTQPEFKESVFFPRSFSEETRIALEDYKGT